MPCRCDVQAGDDAVHDSGEPLGAGEAVARLGQDLAGRLAAFLKIVAQCVDQRTAQIVTISLAELSRQLADRGHGIVDEFGEAGSWFVGGGRH